MTVTGEVFNGCVIADASITAYLVNADGSNGAAITIQPQQEWKK